MRRRRRNPDVSTWLTWGVIAVGLYFVYKMFTGAKTAVLSAQSAAGSAVADLFPNNVLNAGKTPVAGDPRQFTVTMADGSTQVVNSGGVPVANPANAPLDTSLIPDFSAGNF